MPAEEPTTTPVCIVGAGPHGLAMALFVQRADPDLAERLVVLDPSGDWLTTWHAQFARLDIDVLRSPVVHHPGPDVDGLSSFVNREGLRRSGLPYDPPMTDAFTSYCHELIADAGLRSPVAARPTAITRDGAGLRIETSGPTVLAERMVIASNPHKRTVPEWVWPTLGRTGAEILHAADVDLRAIDDLHGERVVVLGAGLSAGHLACGAADRGARVSLITRRAITTRAFDTDPGWLGPKYLRGFDDIDAPGDRITRAIEARGGGSMPEWMIHRLERHCASGRLTIHEADPVTDADAGPDRYRLMLESATTIDLDRLWIASGTTPDIAALRALQPLLPDVATVAGYPVTDDDLRVGLHPIHVMGRLATHTLGPACGNLWGARTAARRITRAITGIDLDAVSSRPRRRRR